MTRRIALRNAGIVAGGAALAAGTGAGTGAASAAVRGAPHGGGRPRHGTVRTYVLVHGTHSAGAYWTPIARELTLRGHRVVAVDQPLHGAEAFVPEAYQTQDLRALATEPSPVARLGLDDYARRVEQAVRRAAEHGPLVLVAHSMGGISVTRTGNAVPELIDHICYMASFCPSRSMPTLNDCMSAPESASAVSTDEQVVGDMERLGVARFNWRTGRRKDLDVFKEMICADHPDDAFRRVIAGMQTDETLRAYGERAVGERDTWGRVPRTYLRFGRDRLVTPELQDRMINEADRLTPGNQFTVHDFTRAPHIGPLDPAPVVDALEGVAVRRR